MFKKLLSLTLLLILLFNNNNFEIWALEDDVFSSQGISINANKKFSSYIDECKDAANNIPDVDCAIRATILDMKGHRSNQKTVRKIGLNNEYDIHLWAYPSISNFVFSIERLIETASKESVLKGTLANALNASIIDLQNFLTVNSVDESKAALERWLLKSKHFNNETLAFLKNEIINTLKVDNHLRHTEENKGRKAGKDSWGTGGQYAGGTVGALAAGGYAAYGLAAKSTLALTLKVAASIGGPAVIGAVGGALVIGKVCSYIGGAVGAVNGRKVAEEKIAQKAKEYLKTSKEFEIKTDVYADTIEQVFDKITLSEWKNNDILLARLNFDSLYHETYTEFRKEGFYYDKETIASKFKKVSERLIKLMKDYNIGKDL